MILLFIPIIFTITTLIIIVNYLLKRRNLERYILCQNRLVLNYETVNYVNVNSQICASNFRHGIIDWEFTNLELAKKTFNKVKMYDNCKHLTVLFNSNIVPIMISHDINIFEEQKITFLKHIKYKRSLE